ncbi:MAG: UPF0182 family protein, partial [Deltaproteobacteria bacterium]|nr:UPF0182 family protein [Deltaproteobacteria bacterium]
PILLPTQQPGGGVWGLDIGETQLKRLALLLSLAAGAMLGVVASGAWSTVLLALHGGAVGYQEPVFGRDAGFYLFVMPLLPWLKGLFWGIWLLGTFGSVAIYLGRRELVAVRADGTPVARSVASSLLTGPVRRHTGTLLACFFLLLAVFFQLERYSLLFAQDGLFAGPGYADVHARLPLLQLAALCSLLAAVLVLFGFWWTRSTRPALLGVGLVAIAWLLQLGVPALVQRLIVAPNELAREQPFLDRHIKATIAAFGLTDLSEGILSGDATLDREALDANQATLQNIPLWDQSPLLDTFEQLQEIRTYYEFVSVDNDRYLVDGQLRQTMLSPRELQTASLPNRTWINEVLTFTHGYGLTLGPVNQITEEGLPELWLQDLPPRTKIPSLAIQRPEIYYGEILSDHVFVSTGTREFDYPSGDESVFTTYSGRGDLPVSGLLERLLFALRFGNLKVLLSGDFTAATRVQLHRRIRERVDRLAPFLRYDRDPYMVIADGRLLWIIDGYTWSNHYPYAQAAGSLGNYMRNPVKVVIDAYEGTTTFYLVQEEEPLIAAWSGIFPGMLRPLQEMPATVRAHLRHPEDLFTVQAHVYATYHMREAAIFYNKEDQWEIPIVGEQPMKPHYIVMRLPGEEKEEFILMLPFTPRRKDNLAAWMVARCDGEHYGQLRAFRFPKHKLVFGPRQVVARINQDPEISRQISLWDQRGSQVLWGTMQVIPVRESLLYIRPLYLKAESGRIPELKRVVVGYQNRIAMEPTLEEALTRIFGPPGSGGGEPGLAGAASLEGEPAGGVAARRGETTEVGGAPGVGADAGADPGAGAAAAAGTRPGAVIAGSAGPPPAVAMAAATGLPAGGGAPAARIAGSGGAGAGLAHQAWLHYQQATRAAQEGRWAVYGEEIARLGEVLRTLAEQGQAAEPAGAVPLP